MPRGIPNAKPQADSSTWGDVSTGNDTSARHTALDFAMQAAAIRPQQFVSAQQVVQEAERYLAFLTGEGE